MDKRPALGKGLSALIPDVPEPTSALLELDVDRLTPSKFQPRGQVDEAGLEELAQSIKSNGVIQPILVRRAGDQFQIIAGERRWRAAQKAGLHRVPVIVRDVVPGQNRSLLEMALIENIQRENLNPMDEALAYRRLIDEFQLSQEQIAAAVGKDRASVANYLRLLKLPDDVRAKVASGALSMGHARALVGASSAERQRYIADEVIRRSLSVRETEALVKRTESGAGERRPTKLPDVHTRAAEDRLRLALGTRVRIVRRGTRGRIEIDFGSENELIRIYDWLIAGRGN